jgi:hypothetical protein
MPFRTFGDQESFPDHFLHRFPDRLAAHAQGVRDFLLTKPRTSRILVTQDRRPECVRYEITNGNNILRLY